MGDIFKEQIVRKIPNKSDKLKQIGVLVILFISSITISMIPVIAPLSPAILICLCFLAFYLMTYFKIEYEYIFTNGTLDVDIIYNKSRRKRVFSADVKDFELIAHVDNKEQVGNFSSATGVFDFSSGVVKANTYACLTKKDGKIVKLIIEPNELLVKAFSSYVTPRKFFK